MNQLNKRHMLVISLLSFFTLIFFNPSNVSSHGTDEHTKTGFTHYDAMKNGIDIFEKLLMKKKLDPEWEVDLSAITVRSTMMGNEKEIVVQFTREKSDPKNLYIFYTNEGKYKGSNFKGR